MTVCLSMMIILRAHRESITNNLFLALDSDGRVTFALIEVPGQEVSVELKYQLLNPAPNFLEVVEEARSVILAGGTMSPVSLFQTY